MKDLPDPPDVLRLPELLVVDEKERLVAAVEAREHHRSAEIEAGLVLEQLRFRQPVALVEPAVGVERVAPVLMEQAAVKIVGARFRGVANLRRAAAGAL